MLSAHFQTVQGQMGAGNEEQMEQLHLANLGNFGLVEPRQSEMEEITNE